MLQHPYLIRYSKSERTAASSLTDHNGKYRNGKSRQRIEIFRNSFTLSSFFCFQSAECTWRIHKADHRSVKFLCLLHQTQRFPVAFRRNHSKIPGNIFPGALTFFLCKNRHRLSVKKCHTADHCRIITTVAVTVKFHEIVKECLDVVFSRGTCFCSGKLDMFPGSVIS